VRIQGDPGGTPRWLIIIAWTWWRFAILVRDSDLNVPLFAPWPVHQIATRQIRTWHITTWQITTWQITTWQITR
jgi:hypothetical protein